MPIPRVQNSGRKKVGARDPQMAPKWPPNRLGVTPKTHAEVHEHKLITIRLSVPSIGNGDGEKAAGNRDSAHLKTCCSLPTRIGAALHVMMVDWICGMFVCNVCCVVGACVCLLC